MYKMCLFIPCSFNPLQFFDVLKEHYLFIWLQSDMTLNQLRMIMTVDHELPGICTSNHSIIKSYNTQVKVEANN